MEHRDLVREWIEIVILFLAKDEYEEKGADAIFSTEHNIPTTPLEQAQLIVPGWLDAVVVSPDKDEEEETDVYVIPTERNIPADSSEQVQSNVLMRSASINTRASQSSAWNDAERTSDYAADLISKVLRSKYSPSAGTQAFSMPLQEAFQHLDWTKRGWLPRAVVKEQCHRASTKVPALFTSRSILVVSSNSSQNCSAYILIILSIKICPNYQEVL